MRSLKSASWLDVGILRGRLHGRTEGGFVHVQPPDVFQQPLRVIPQRFVGDSPAAQPAPPPAVLLREILQQRHDALGCFWVDVHR